MENLQVKQFFLNPASTSNNVCYDTILVREEEACFDGKDKEVVVESWLCFDFGTECPLIFRGSLIFFKHKRLPQTFHSLSLSKCPPLTL